MSELLPVNIDGETIYIETEAEYGTEQTTSAEAVLKNVQNALEHTKRYCHWTWWIIRSAP